MDGVGKEIELAEEVAKTAVSEINKFKNEAVATITQDHSMAMTIIELLKDELADKTKIIKWLVTTIAVCNLIWACLFGYYVWLPSEEETITIESQDTGHAIYGDNGAEAN